MPEAGRPHIPDYGIPESEAGMLAWSWAHGLLEEAPTYWVASTRPDGRPHVTPIWGAWVEERFWFEGGPHTRRARNLAANPATVVHVERGDDVVIVEGTAQVVEPAGDLVEALVEGYAKYRTSHDYEVDPTNWRDGGLWAVSPVVAFGWTRFPTDATRWRF
ncbi:MAG: pyridoxamine 5'-phosphate oxidase family protein [Acidimicrobiia bacterium]